MTYKYRFTIISIVLFTLLAGCKAKEGPRGLRVGDEIVEPFMGIVVEIEGTPPMVITKITKDRVELSRLGRVVNDLTYEEIDYLFAEGKLGNLTKARKENSQKKDTDN